MGESQELRWLTSGVALILNARQSLLLVKGHYALRVQDGSSVEAEQPLTPQSLLALRYETARSLLGNALTAQPMSRGLHPHAGVMVTHLLTFPETPEPREVCPYLEWSARYQPPAWAQRIVQKVVATDGSANRLSLRPALDTLLRTDHPHEVIELSNWVLEAEPNDISVRLARIEAHSMLGDKQEEIVPDVLQILSQYDAANELSRADAATIDNCVRALKPGDVELLYLEGHQALALRAFEHFGVRLDIARSWFNRALLQKRFSLQDKRLECLRKAKHVTTEFGESLEELSFTADVITELGRALIDAGESTEELREAMLQQIVDVLQRAVPAGLSQITFSRALMRATMVKDGNSELTVVGYSAEPFGVNPQAGSVD